MLDQVCAELWKQRITDPNLITFKKVREVLKQLKLRKQYEHTTQITCKITGRPLPKLSTRTQELAKLMFRAAQEPFARHAGAIAPNRRNFLSYSYILYQFLILLGESNDILDCFVLLKGKDKRQRMVSDERIVRQSTHIIRVPYQISNMNLPRPSLPSLSLLFSLSRTPRMSFLL